MATRREQILSRLASVLASASGVSGRVYRSRVEAVTRGETPCVIVEPLSDQPAQTTLATLDWSLVARVSIYTRGATPDVLADPVVDSAFALIMSDTTLNGYAIDVLPSGVNYQIDQADQPSCVVEMDFTIRYRTPMQTLTVA